MNQSERRLYLIKSLLKVVFNVFQKEDYEIYKKLLTDCSDGFDS